MPELANVNLSYNLLNYLPGDPEDASAQNSSGRGQRSKGNL